jgi:hypothetical protein
MGEADRKPQVAAAATTAGSLRYRGKWGAAS